MAFSFTQDQLAEALINKAADRVAVRIIMDEEQAFSNTGGDYELFRQAGLDVRLDGNPGQMHHKVIIVDGERVAFGSYNFSYSAESRNDENLVIVHDPAFAAQFRMEFERIYKNVK